MFNISGEKYGLHGDGNELKFINPRIEKSNISTAFAAREKENYLFISTALGKFAWLLVSDVII